MFATPMEWNCLENDWQKLYLSQCEQSHIVGNEGNRSGTRECNCSVLCEQRLDNVSANRSVSGTTIIATNYR